MNSLIFLFINKKETTTPMSLVHTLGVTYKTEATIHEIHPDLYHLQTILLLVIHEKIRVI